MRGRALCSLALTQTKAYSMHARAYDGDLKVCSGRRRRHRHYVVYRDHLDLQMGIGGLGIQMRRGGRENRGGWKDLCTYQTSKQDHPAAAAKARTVG